MGSIHCLLSSALLQPRCFQDLVIFSRSKIESILSKLVGILLTLLCIVLLEIWKITLNSVNIVAIGLFPAGQQCLLYSCERNLKYSLDYHMLARY